MNGGALLDYRTREGLSAVHKAALSGKAESIKVCMRVGNNLGSYWRLEACNVLVHLVLTPFTKLKGVQLCCIVLTLCPFSEILQ